MQQLVKERGKRAPKASKSTPTDAGTVTPAAPPKIGAIRPASWAIIHLPIRNMPGSPLVVHAFSAKSREQMRAAQEAGSVTKKNRRRDPKDFEGLYQGARHISREGWDGIAAAAFRSAAVSACRFAGFTMTHGKGSVFIEPDGVDRADGMPLVRVHGTPVAFEAMVRLPNGSVDIVVRPRWDDWTANIGVRFDQELFTPEDVMALMERAGAQVGVGEGRPGSKNSHGQGWGLFEIDTGKRISISIIEPKRYSFTVEKA